MTFSYFLTLCIISACLISSSLQQTCNSSTTINCLTCNTTNANQCMTCNNSFFVTINGSACDTCANVYQNCQGCSLSNGTTTCTGGCSTGLYLNDQLTLCASCSNTIANCSICSTDNTNKTLCNKCASANFSLVPSSDLKSCINCSSRISGCQSCQVNSSTGNSTCLACNLSGGIVPALDGSSCMSCGSAIANCLQCNVSQGMPQCMACSNSLVPNMNDHLSCVSCRSQITNCSSCAVDATGASTCSVCDQGFFPDPDFYSCDTCNNTIQGCVSCQINNNTNMTYCSQCNTGYLYHNGTCWECPEGCANCSDNTTCTNCYPGFTLNNVSCFNPVSNCTKYDTSSGISVCTSCSYGMGVTATGNCQLCTSTDCAVCSFDSSFNETCLSCLDPTYYLIGGRCTACSAYNSNYYTCNYDGKNVIPYDCVDGLYPNANNCAPCTSVMAGCQSCTGTSPNNFTCTYCSHGYFRVNQQCKACNANCDECDDANTCYTCSAGYYWNSTVNSCLACSFAAGSNCGKCASDGKTCTDCAVGFYNSSSGVCTSCSANCTSCSSNNCYECASGFYLVNDGQGVKYCSANCSLSTLIADSTSMTCTACSTLFPWYSDCNTCSSRTNCTACVGGKIPYSDGSNCTFCNGTSETKKTAKGTCDATPTITLSSVVLDTNKFPNANITCSVSSMVYYTFYVGSASQNTMTWQTINALTGNTTNKTIPATDLTVTWAAYGVIPMVTKAYTPLVFPRPFKYSGETYTLVAFCVSYSGLQSSMQSISWSFPSNGASEAVINLVSATPLNRTQKKQLGAYVKKALGLNRQMYTDQGDLVGTSSRLLQNGTNSTSNSSNATNSSSSSNTTNSTTVSFYVLPDYTAVNDTMNSVINTALANSTAFVATLTAAIGSAASFSITGASLGQTISAQPTPLFANTSPNITVSSIYLIFTLNVTNTNGTVYMAVGKTLATSRLLQGNGTNTTNGTNTSNSSSTTNSSTNTSNSTTYNQTAPSWTQFLNGTDAAGTPFIASYNTSVTMGIPITVNLSGLTANTTYNIYFGAVNQMMPAQYSSIYVVTATTNVSGSSNNTNGSTSGEKLMAGVALILMACIAIIFG